MIMCHQECKSNRRTFAKFFLVLYFTRSVDVGTCHICGDFGHKRRDCLQRPDNSPRKRYCYFANQNLLTLSYLFTKTECEINP